MYLLTLTSLFKALNSSNVEIKQHKTYSYPAVKH